MSDRGEPLMIVQCRNLRAVLSMSAFIVLTIGLPAMNFGSLVDHRDPGWANIKLGRVRMLYVVAACRRPDPQPAGRQDYNKAQHDKLRPP